LSTQDMQAGVLLWFLKKSNNLSLRFMNAREINANIAIKLFCDQNRLDLYGLVFIVINDLFIFPL